MTQNIPEKISLEKFVDITLKNKILFFAGSGISLDYPTFLPSAKQMLKDITLPITAPSTYKEKELNFKSLVNSLPELYYESIIDIVEPESSSPETKRIWEVLKFGQTREELEEYDLGPNLGHIILVYLAWRNNLPLITVNYDLMFELAAKKIGLEPKPCYPGKSGGFERASSKKEVSIWKLHGSVENIDSIRTSLYTITRADRSIIEQLRQLFEKHRSCLVGYSGRDIDIFPFIVSFDLPPSFWLAPNFEKSNNKKHRIFSYPNKFTMVKGYSSNLDKKRGKDFARLTIKNLDNKGPVRKDLINIYAKWKELNKNKIDKTQKNVKSKFQKLGRNHVQKIIEDKLPPDSKDRLLIHGLALSSVCENKDALYFLEEYLRQFQSSEVTPKKVCRALLVRAYSLHELSRYIFSEFSAHLAYKIASENNLSTEKAHSVTSIDSALREQHLPKIGFKDLKHLTRPKTYLVFAKLIFHSLKTIGAAYFPSFSSNPNTSQRRARWAYLGHLGRTLSMIQGGISSIPLFDLVVESLPSKLLSWFWNHYLDWSQQAGYPRGIARGHKYLNQIRTEEAHEVSSQDYPEVISGHSDLALIHYERGMSYLEKDKQRSIEEFNESWKYAKKAGNQAVILKNIIGLSRCGVEIDYDKVKEVIKSIQGKAFREVESDLLAKFKNTND